MDQPPESKAAALQMADRLFSEINEKKTLQRYENALESVAVLAGTAARMPGMATVPVGDGMSHPGMELMLEALGFYDYIFSTYIGYDDGSFIQIVALRDQPELRRLFGAPVGTTYVLRTISADSQGMRATALAFSEPGNGRSLEKETAWTRITTPAQGPGIFVPDRWRRRFSPIRMFSAPRNSPASPARNGCSMAAGSSVPTSPWTGFPSHWRGKKWSDNGTLFLFDRTGRIIAHPKEKPIKGSTGESLNLITGDESADPLVRAIVADYLADPEVMRNHTREMEIGGSAYLVRSTAIKADLKFDQILASIAPVSDFTGHIRRMQQRIFLFSGLVLLVVLPLSLLVSRKISGSLVLLEQESRKIQGSDFSESKPFDSNIKEIHSLIKAFVLMKSTIRDYTARLIQAKVEIEDLFTAITKLLPGAIDAKSPYTGGHCKRVPIVAEMLATAAHSSTDTPFADFCHGHDG